MSEVFSMAQVSVNTWDAFVKVNNLYESGKLKGQKLSAADVASGTISLKQWYMKPLVSLPDDSKLYLLNKVRKTLLTDRNLVGTLVVGVIGTDPRGEGADWAIARTTLFFLIFLGFDDKDNAWIFHFNYRLE